MQRRMPGFTAEQSLLESDTQDRLNSGFADSIGEATIIPQRIKLRSVRCICDIYDFCVCNV
jgi:hypothetical protein